MKKLLSLLLVLMLLAGAKPAEAALSASGVFQIQSTATSGNVNAGYFNPANANLLTDGAATSATGNAAVFTSASYSGVSGDANAWIYILSGTSWNPVCYYKITSVSGGAFTLDSTAGHGVCVANNRYSVTTSAGVASTASPTGATWGIDYSRLDGADLPDTDLVSTNGTTNPCQVTSVLNPFGVQDVANGVHINSGTSWLTGWYEIISVSGVTATLDRACASSASVTAGTAKVGGALSLGSTDSAVWALGLSSSTAATRYFVKGNATYTAGGSSGNFSSGSTLQWPIIIEGYNAYRGDRPTDSTRPVMAMGTNLFTLGNTSSGGNKVVARSMQFTGTGSTAVVAIGRSGELLDSYVYNNSTTASRPAITTAFYSLIRKDELISLRGPAISAGNTNTYITENYIHDSDTGFVTTVSGIILLTNNIFANNVTYDVNTNVALTSTPFIVSNTFYGAENKLGTGINIITGTTFEPIIRNNIFYGLTTGIASADSSSTGGTFNDYFNNTTDISNTANFQKGSSDLALDPQFAGVAQRTGSTATTTSGNHLVQSGATFVSWGVTPGRDFLYISSGTGASIVGKYGILSVDSETQITTDIALTADATADKTWQITIGRNFAIGTNLKAAGSPAAFPGGYTTGYTDIGAVQRQENTSPTVHSSTFVQ